MSTHKYVNALLIMAAFFLLFTACRKQVRQTPIQQHPTSNFRIEHGIIYDKTNVTATIKLEDGRKLHHAFNLPFTIGDRVNLSYLNNKLTEIEIVDIGTVKVYGNQNPNEDLYVYQEEDSQEPEMSLEAPPETIENKREVSKQTDSARIVAFDSRSWAVIVGVSKYKYANQGGLTNLNFADNDAKDFARVLENIGWSRSHIKLLINEEATQRNVLIALESWLTKSGPNDQIILYWSGHGFPDPEDQQKVYFACHDTDITIPATGFRMDRVRNALEERRSRNVVILADTCHAGKLITRGIGDLSIAPQLNKMRRDKDIPKGWIFMVSADADRQAIEHSSWANGAFTHLLLKGLKGEADGFENSGKKDGIVTMGELRVFLSSWMPELTQKVLGVAKRPLITTGTGNPDIWNMTFHEK